MRAAASAALFPLPFFTNRSKRDTVSVCLVLSCRTTNPFYE
ncbi:hypothetical protein KNP414_00804 [Paenibacillus mucilaginosus KNP414]|uniref:Uncharacterized protein n=1 Tax=Paenibacillus mucilaginosus (strain KNP414) TaxID=1036673 RepID=F8F4K2_PAEMK|nr:hypothetical protein KNP414_00804 [Paenibacillus mucilaginosus KNP414]